MTAIFAHANYGGTGAKTLSYLVKGVLTPLDGHRLAVSLLNTHMTYPRYAEDTTDTSVLNETDWRTNDRTASIEYNWHPADSKLIDLKVRGSHSSTSSSSKAVYSGATDFTGQGSVKTDYFEAENSSVLNLTDSIGQRFRYGFDWTRDKVDLTYTDYVNGGTLGGSRKQFGAYATDTLSFGRLADLIGTVRYDQYTIAAMGESGKGEHAISPTLTAIVRPFENTALKGLSFTGLLGKGFKAPTITNMYGQTVAYGAYTGTYDETTGYYSDSASCSLIAATVGGARGGNTTCYLANPNLKGEKDYSYELGAGYQRQNLLQQNDALSLRVNYIHTKIKDRITSVNLGTTALGYIIAQYQNIENALVKGWEVSANYDSEHVFARFSMEDMKGWDQSDGSRLTDLKPRNISAGIGTHFDDRKATVGIDVRSRAKLYVPTASTCTRNCTDTLYPKFTVFDIYGSWQVTDSLRLQARVANVFDKLYTKGSYSTTTAADDIVYYAGRNLKLDLSYRF